MEQDERKTQTFSYSFIWNLVLFAFVFFFIHSVNLFAFVLFNLEAIYTFWHGFYVLFLRKLISVSQPLANECQQDLDARTHACMCVITFHPALGKLNLIPRICTACLELPKLFGRKKIFHLNRNYTHSFACCLFLSFPWISKFFFGRQLFGI